MGADDPVAVGDAATTREARCSVVDVVVAVLLGWLRPGWAARRSANVGLLAALFVYVFGVIAAAGSSQNLLQEFPAGEVGMGITFAIVALGLSLLGAPMGARHEPLLDSVRHSMRRTLMFMPYMLLIVAAVALLSEVLSASNRSWVRDYEQRVSVHDVAGGYESAHPPAHAWHAYLLRRYEAKPWLLKYNQGVSSGVCVLGMLWWLCAWLCALGAERTHRSRSVQPLCESCGYDLRGAAEDARCSECGLDVHAALGVGRQDGTFWSRRREVGLVRAWWRCVIDVALRPTAFSRKLSAVVPDKSCRWLFYLHLPAIVLVWLLVAFIAEGMMPTSSGISPSGWETTLVACVGAGLSVYVLMTLGVSLLVGFWWSFRSKPNALVMSGQMAFYASPLSALLSLMTGCMLLLAIGLTELGWAGPWLRSLGLHSDVVFAIVLFGPAFLLGFALLFIVHRGTRAARYASR